MAVGSNTNSVVKSLNQIEHWARALFVVASALIVPTIAGIITADAVFRYTANSPFIWTQDVVGLLLFVLFCTCFPYSWHGKFHVRLALIYEVFPQQVRKVVDFLTVITAFGFGAVLAYQCFMSTFVAYRTEATMPSSQVLLIWPFVLGGAVSFFSFCLLMIVAILQIWFSEKNN